MGIKHAHNATQSDGSDSSLLQPSDWNASHTIDSSIVESDAIWDAAGDLAVGSGANTAARLAAGAAGGVLAMGNSAVIWNAGTSFPASKATGDRYFRTDLGSEFYWDGTRWVTTQEFTFAGATRSAIGSGFNASTPSIVNMTIPGVSCYITSFRAVTYVASANDGSKYWTVEVSTLTPDNTAAVIAQISTGDTPDGNTTWTPHDDAVGVAVVAADYPVLRVGCTKVSIPGSLILGFELRYRVIAT